jgi:hypothetical protein
VLSGRWRPAQGAGIDRRSFPARGGFTFHDPRHTFGTACCAGLAAGGLSKRTWAMPTSARRWLKDIRRHLMLGRTQLPDPKRAQRFSRWRVTDAIFGVRCGIRKATADPIEFPLGLNTGMRCAPVNQAITVDDRKDEADKGKKEKAANNGGCHRKGNGRGFPFACYRPAAAPRTPLPSPGLTGF